jgi:uncharacterized protein
VFGKGAPPGSAVTVGRSAPTCAQHFLLLQQSVKIEFDPDKDEKNVKKHGLSLNRFVELDLLSGIIEPDARRDYSEERYLALALLAGRLHAACFCIRGDAFRVISLRKASNREVRRYERAQAE